MGAVVGDHRAFRLGVALFQRADLLFLHIHRAEHEIDFGGHFFHMGGIQHHHILDLLRHGVRHGPAAANGLFVGLARRTGRSRHHGQMEPGMLRQQRHETLADHAGGAHNAHLILFHSSLVPFRKALLCSPVPGV